MDKEMLSGFIPFKVRNSRVKLNKINASTASDNNIIQYISSNGNNISITDSNLHSVDFITYAYNHSRVLIDDNTLSSMKYNDEIPSGANAEGYAYYIQDDNSFINYNNNISSMIVTELIDNSNSITYYPSIYNDGNTYIKYDNIDDITEKKINSIIKIKNISQLANCITIDSPNSTSVNKLLKELQKKLNTIPKKLNRKNIRNKFISYN